MNYGFGYQNPTNICKQRLVGILISLETKRFRNQDVKNQGSHTWIFIIDKTLTLINLVQYNISFTTKIDYSFQGIKVL